MVNFKLVISEPKSGKTLQREVKDDDASYFLNKKIGDKADGNSFGLQGYEFEITGGSDFCGFPMRKGIPGTKRKKILTLESVGFRGVAKGRTKKKKKQRPKRKGLRRKKTVCGELIHEQISQINLKTLKEGKEKLFEEVKAEAEKKEETAPEAKKEEGKKPEPKVEAKKAEEKKEKPKTAEKK